MIILMLLVFLLFPLQGCHLKRQPQVIHQSEISDPYSWNFGQVKEGEILKHNFILKNESGGILNIKDITTSCGCAISKVKTKTLLPGDSTLLEVKFDTKGYSGLTQQYVYVNTDDLNRPVIRFIIKAEIVKNSQQSTVNSP